jgi:pyrrolidone-carboxylate peptidase
MVRAMNAPRWLLPPLALAGCAVEPTDDDAPTPDAVTLDTRSPQARAQYDANARFALTYAARCAPVGTRPRALVTGFGRFLDNATNATGQTVSALVPAAEYPFTERPAAGAVDLPGPQTRVAVGTVDVPGVGAVDVCAMILPVYWDLAAILVLKEVERFNPAVVVMNGIASPRQDLWVELGGVNRAMVLADGSDVLVPQPPAGQRFAALVPSAPASALRRGALLSWDGVKAAAAQVITDRATTLDGETRLDARLTGVAFGGFPRAGNTYLCNNLSYVVGYAMDNPGRTLTLLQASVPLRGAVNRVPVRLTRDHRATPRVFLHWPSTLAGAHLEVGAEVLRAVVGAQLRATRGGDLPTRGDNARAELQPSGDTF